LSDAWLRERVVSDIVVRNALLKAVQELVGKEIRARQESKAPLITESRR
jgi:hypothetical protein